MLLEKIKKYSKEEYDLNCAEKVLYSANEEYNMNLTKEVFKTMAAFGGGMAVEGVCGAISGSIAVLGILFVQDRAHESDKIKELTERFIREFKDKLDTDNCLKLKAKYRNDEIKCNYIVETAGEILDEIVRKNMK